MDTTRRKEKHFLLVVTLRIYALSNFCMYRPAAFMLYITSLVLIYLITGSLYILTTFLPTPLRHLKGNLEET